jgi:hypothetical protein
MKKFFVLVFLAFSFTTLSFAADETVTVEGSRITPGPSPSAFPGGGIAPGRPAPKQPKRLGEGEEGGGGGGVRRGCQECQSDTALYTCGVWKASPINETWDKTQIALSGQNCCAASGGRVLSTRLGSCGS